jgi:hypothetical protein
LTALSSWRRCGALLALCIAAYASSGLCAYAYPDNRHTHSAGIVAVAAAPPAPAYAPAEQASTPVVGSGEESHLATQRSEEPHLAAYLRLHYASEQGTLTLYPLAAFAASARRAGEYTRGAYRGGHYAYARCAAVGAGSSATCVPPCEGR